MTMFCIFKQLVVSCAVVMLMDNGVGAQNTYHYRNAMPASHFRQMQSNPLVSRNIYKPNTIKPVVAKTNNWGWPTAVQQQNRWKVNFDNSIEDHSVESVESSFQRRPSIPRTQRHSITANSNLHNIGQRAWSRPAAVPVRQQQPIRWNKNFHDSDEDHSVESRESRRW